VIVCYLAGGDEIVISIKNMKFYTWTTVPSKKRILSYSSQHGDEDGYALSLCCKFEINLRLFAIWLVVIKLPRQLKYEFYAWAAVPPEQRVASSSSQHGDEDQCTLSHIPVSVIHLLGPLRQYDKYIRRALTILKLHNAKMQQTSG